MSDELKDRVKNIANQNIVINGEKKSILNQNMAKITAKILPISIANGIS